MNKLDNKAGNCLGILFGKECSGRLLHRSIANTSYKYFIITMDMPLDYVEPAKGMAAMRMRILRAELQAACKLSVYDAETDGNEVMADVGELPQPRTTSTGALIPVSVSGDQNSTFARSIRADGWVYLARDGSRHPLHPTSHGIKLHPRRGSQRQIPVSIPVVVDEIVDANQVANEQSTGRALLNWVWTTSTAVLPGAAAIVSMNGARLGQGSDVCMGMFILLGTSEMTDYPVLSTAWNHTEPILKHASQTAVDTITNVSDMASEGVRASVRYLGIMVCGLLSIGFSLWTVCIWIAESIIRRTKKV